MKRLQFMRGQRDPSVAGVGHVLAADAVVVDTYTQGVQI